MPHVAPGISISELHFKLPQMTLTTVREKVRELVAEKRVIKVPAAEVGGTPRYHLPSEAGVEV